MTLVVESDIGAFQPLGLAFSGSAAAAAVMQEVMALLAPINATALLVGGSGYETDTAYWAKDGVPGASLASHNDKYFNYHHSNGDQMNVLSASEMDLAAAVFAVAAFVVADLDAPLPRNDDDGHPAEEMVVMKEDRSSALRGAGSLVVTASV